VLQGSSQTFEIEYQALPNSGQQWYRMTAVRLPRAEGGAVVSHINITQQKMAELEEERMQEELILLNRLSEMGQLAASLAHELAQPMAAALTNAQAALRLAGRPEPDLGEVQAALVDIIEDDKRARGVLNSIRSILKKHSVAPHPVDLNETVESVTAIVRNNAQLRGVQIKSVLGKRGVRVQGDEVSLQQVLLNLMNNSIDAMSHLPPDRRILTVKTRLDPESKSGVLIVEDQGAGVPAALKEQIFSPFFTTKNDGLGMGLAICRTILKNLGGSITCDNRPQGGTAFSVTLPQAP
jgi:two-component system, LuxR family, sensor kinase FixL